MLKIGAIKFNFTDLFTWTSGIKSPVYCDNRVALSNCNIRNTVRDGYIEIIRKEFPDVEVIAGVATGAIAQGALIADRLNLPFIYVREKRKEHGLKKIIEGYFEKGQKIVIIEDLISTGGSSIKSFNELIQEEADVLGMAAAFSYDFLSTREKFINAACKVYTISTFLTIKETALKEGYINKDEYYKLEDWHKSI